MSSLAQTLVAVLLVAAAAVYVTRKVWQSVAKARRDRDATTCGTDGCCK